MAGFLFIISPKWEDVKHPVLASNQRGLLAWSRVASSVWPLSSGDTEHFAAKKKKKKKMKKKWKKKIVAEKHFWFQIHIICKVRFLDRPSRQARLGICSGNNMICCRIVDVTASFGSTVSETIHELLDVESSFWNLVLCHFCWFYCQNMSLYWTQSSFSGLPPEAGLGGACI